MLKRIAAAWPLSLPVRLKPGRSPLDKSSRACPPGKGDLPLGGVSGTLSGAGWALGKRVRRGALSVQLTLRAARRSHVLPFIGLLTALVLILIIAATRPARKLFTPRACFCPTTPAERATMLELAKTALVVRIGSSGELHPLATLLGPPCLLRHPLELEPADVTGCGDLRAGALALLLLDDTARAADRKATAPAAPLLGCAQAALFPWRDWDDVARPPSQTGLPWWRAPRQRALWLEAKLNAARATAGKVPLPRAEWWVRPGVSVVAACMDRPDTLAKASASWFKALGVDEVVLVDWGSAKHAVNELPTSARNDARLVSVRVEGEKLWALSRAYNLAMALSSRETVLKVDCDTLLGTDFVKRHTLQGGDFYAGDWRAVNLTSKKKSEENKLHVNGLLLARRDHILAVGGYDERIATYGWDDTDLVERLAATREYRRFDYSDVEHIPHPATLRVVHQGASALLPRGHPQAAAVEIQRNRILLSNFGLKPWRATSRRTVWDIELRSSADARGGTGVFGRAVGVAPSTPGGPTVLVATAAMTVPSLTDLVTKEQSLAASAGALRTVLGHMRNRSSTELNSAKVLKNTSLGQLQSLITT